MIKLRVVQNRDIVGYNLAALRAVARIANEQTPRKVTEPTTDIWAGMGFGSDLAAALERKADKRRKV